MIPPPQADAKTSSPTQGRSATRQPTPSRTHSASACGAGSFSQALARAPLRARRATDSLSERRSRLVRRGAVSELGERTAGCLGSLAGRLRRALRRQAVGLPRDPQVVGVPCGVCVCVCVVLTTPLLFRSLFLYEHNSASNRKFAARKRTPAVMRARGEWRAWYKKCCGLFFFFCEGLHDEISPRDSA